ncbi:MAG: molybdenum cofactor biosynthesis protein [Gallionellales bacterium RIFCSPLOWO2_12_FULL_57_18]|nr:MAG: molybdenum cofactor biosynthesis protein [Gallionellales bacterium RIFCSPLOWO2_12_FULL_57_18]OGS96835.1 MAG: molybdenum cofactor biosynthesis protein [Gallionellales bacterium RIFCSPLOWO2_02_FULL_57_47]
MEHLQVSEAQRLVLESVVVFGAEQVELEQALGRVLAEEVCANRDQPPYDISAMDGYALRSADLANVPATLQIIEDIKAGDMPTKVLAPGQCARIMTGAPLPQGADAVIRVEETEVVSAEALSPNSDETTSHSTKPASGQVAGYLPQAGERDAASLRELITNAVRINHAVKPGNDIRRLGENMFNGEVVLRPGTEITPGVIGVLATVKHAQVRVYRRPRVAILSTGNELEGLDEPVDPDKIPDANSYALMAQTQALGIEPVLLGIARDDPEELARYLKRGLEYDVLLVSGGTSVGVHDYVRPTIEALGVQMLFWRVAMKPGHPVAFGKAGEKIIFGLPGNPVSSMVCFEQFVAPALRRMMGHARIHRRTIEARLTHDVKHQAGRTEFIRVLLAKEQSGYTATSTGAQGSGMLLSMARADGLAVVPGDSSGLVAGSMVTVQLLDGTTFQDDAGFRE